MRLGQVGGIGREYAVGDVDLRGVDQGLAVIAQIARLRAFAVLARGIVDRIAHAVEREQPVGACGEQDLHHDRHERRAARRLHHAGVLGQIVEPEHEAGEPRRSSHRGDALDRQHGARRFDHYPQRDMRAIA